MSNQKKILLQALSQDLYRAAMGRHRGQKVMAAKFTKEAINRINEIGDFEFRDVLISCLNSQEDRSAEDLLMYSTLVKNRAV